MEPSLDIDPQVARALLEWQLEMGVDEVMAAAPINRYDLAAKPPKPAAKPTPAHLAPVPAAAQVDPVAEAQTAARAAATLEALHDALATFPHCELRKGARNLVFADGRPEARVMVIGEAPGRDEDQQGRPFVGQAGQLLDKMLGGIDMARDHVDATRAVYITNVLPWRPPQNRDPKPEEVAMLLPFLARHVELVDPDVIVLMGNHACRAALGRAGITRLRGQWAEAFGKPALPMFHPAYLLRSPAAKREAWADLLDLSARVFP